MSRQQRPPIPRGATPAEEWTLQATAAVEAVRTLTAFGLGDTSPPLLAVRDPRADGVVWTNPPWVHGSLVTVEDLVPVLEGQAAVPSVRGPRLDVQRAVLTAAGAGTTTSCLWCTSPEIAAMGARRAAPAPLTQDACALYEDIVVVDGSSAAGFAEAVTAAVRGRKGALVPGWGAVTVGSTPDGAAWWAMSLASACRTELIARAAGDPRPLDAVTARCTREQVGTPHGGWHNFQAQKGTGLGAPRTDVEELR